MTTHTPFRHRLGPKSRAALHLLACCPRIPTDVAGQLLMCRRRASATELLARLQAAGLVRAEKVRTGAVVDGRTLRLWSLSGSGRALVATRKLGPEQSDVESLPYGAPGRIRNAGHHAVPLLVAAYRALGAFIATMTSPPEVRAWEQPWMRSLPSRERNYTEHAHVPAAAVLRVNGEPTLRSVLLLPDFGTAPVSSYRPLLRRLTEWQEAFTRRAGGLEPLLVIVTFDQPGSDARSCAWRTLIGHAASQVAEPPLQAVVLTWPHGAGFSAARTRATEGARKSNGDATQLDHVLALLGRHPLLTRVQLAALLNTRPARIGRIQAVLAKRGWLSQITPTSIPAITTAELQRNAVDRLGLAVLTRAGTREAARRLLLPVPQAVRHHGLIQDRPRQRFLRHLAHTVGANAVFVAFVRAAREVTRCGGDDALEEWRSAAACTRGSFRPDGYGSYRRGADRYGFFVEYDRGTERPHEYAAKLAAYYRYRDSRRANMDYVGFPSVLVVTTRDAAEARFAREAYLASERHGGGRLPLLLTTTRRIEIHPQGILGPIWRTADTPGHREPARRYWLPGGATRGLLGGSRVRGATPGIRLPGVASSRVGAHKTDSARVQT
jgi:hypothetical protein